MSVFVWIETFAGRALSGSWEALGAAAFIAQELGSDTTAVIFGQSAEEIAVEATKYGADKGLICDAASLREYRLDTYAALLSSLVADREPSAVVAVTSSRGRELLASSALDTNSGLISDVISLRVNDGGIIGTRPAYAGKVLMDMTARTATTFVTIRGRAFPAPSALDDRSPNVERVAPVEVPETALTDVKDLAAEVGKNQFD